MNLLTALHRRAAALPSPILLSLLLFIAGNTTPGPARAATDEPAVIQQQRDVGAFSAIELQGPYRVIVEAQGVRALQLSGAAERLAEVETLVSGDTLIVRPVNRLRFVFGFKRASEEIIVRIGAPGLKSLKSAGSGQVQLSQLQSGPLALTLTGSGDLSAGGSVGDLVFNSSGSGDADLHLLKSASLQAHMSGSGDLSAADVSQELIAEVSGSGDLQVAALRAARVELQLRGSGNVKLGGSCQDLRAELSGSGDLLGQDFDVQRAVTRSRGSGDVQLHQVKDSLDAEVRGSGELNANLAAKQARISISGNGDVVLSGSVGTLNARLDGSGELRARDLLAGLAEVKVRGSGQALVNVRAKPSGSGPAASRLVRIDRSGAQQIQ